MIKEEEDFVVWFHVEAKTFEFQWLKGPLFSDWRKGEEVCRVVFLGKLSAIG